MYICVHEEVLNQLSDKVTSDITPILTSTKFQIVSRSPKKIRN